MKSMIFACLLAVTVALPDRAGRLAFINSPRSARSDNSDEVVEILRNDRVDPEGGVYSFDFETEDGIKRSESGSPLDSVENSPTGQQGYISFTFPNGEEFELKFVANENGFQPESKWLPVAPEFPHPIPQFVLDQIAKAEREDAEAARAAPSQGRQAAPSQGRQSAPSQGRQRTFSFDDSDERK